MSTVIVLAATTLLILSILLNPISEILGYETSWLLPSDVHVNVILSLSIFTYCPAAKSWLGIVSTKSPVAGS